MHTDIEKDFVGLTELILKLATAVTVKGWVVLSAQIEEKLDF